MSPLRFLDARVEVVYPVLMYESFKTLSGLYAGAPTAIEEIAQIVRGSRFVRSPHRDRGANRGSRRSSSLDPRAECYLSQPREALSSIDGVVSLVFHSRFPRTHSFTGCQRACSVMLGRRNIPKMVEGIVQSVRAERMHGEDAAVRACSRPIPLRRRYGVETPRVHASRVLQLAQYRRRILEIVALVERCLILVPVLKLWIILLDHQTKPLTEESIDVAHVAGVLEGRPSVLT